VTLLLLVSAAWADSWGGLRQTAEILEPREFVVRLPTGRSALGVGPSTEVFLTPFDMIVGGPRLGVEQAVGQWGPLSWSLAPSLAQKLSLRRTGLRLESFLSIEQGADRLSLVVAPDLNLMRRVTLSEEASSAWSLDRTHLPVSLVYDHQWTDTIVRVAGKVGVIDEDRAFSHGTLSASWIQRLGRLHVELGAGVLVGRPSEQTFLGTYERLLVTAYPRLDLWWQGG